MKKMRPSQWSCPKCTVAHDAVRVWRKGRQEWRRLAENQCKNTYITQKRAEGVEDATIADDLNSNPRIFQCQSCNGACLQGSDYANCSSTLSNCINTLLCEKVRVPEMDLKVYDKNYIDTGNVDAFHIYPERCCYGTHAGLVDGKAVRKCGWDATFADMPNQKHMSMDEYTGKVTEFEIRVCPDEFSFNGRVVWSDFIPVVHGASNNNGGDETEHGANDGVRTQKEWLPVSGTVAKFFVHL